MADGATIVNNVGDGVTLPLINIAVGLPGAWPGNYTVSGAVQVPGYAMQTVASTALASSGVPGSGSNYDMIQVDFTAGTATIKTSSSAMPTPDANNIVVFTQVIPSGASSDPTLEGGEQTPDY